MTPLALARAAGKLALSKKGYNVKILKLKKLSTVCDCFVLCTGTVDVHVRAIADAIEEGLHEKGIYASHREGAAGARWVVLDYFDVVVHIFNEEARQFYALEKLWGDAPVESLDDED